MKPATAHVAFLILLSSVSASAQTQLRLPANVFAAQTISGQTTAPVLLPVVEGNGPRVSLTLEDTVRRALENNLDIAVQRINQQTFDLSIANIRSVYSPTLTSVISNQS